MSQAKDRRSGQKKVGEILKESELQDYFYTDAYENKAASAVEEDNDQVASDLLKRRRDRQVIAELHGAIPPSNKDSALINLVNVLTSVLRLNRALYELEHSKIEKGLVYGWSFTLNTTATMHIDFVDNAENEGVPTGVAINAPGSKLFSLQIFNGTGGGNLGFTINKELRESSDEVIVLAGESVTIEFEHPKIAKLNLHLLTGTSAPVRIVGKA